MKKAVNIFLVFCILFLQPRLWTGEGSISELFRFRKTIQQHQNEIASLKERNQQLLDQIKNIKANPEAVEEHARYKLGMIKQGETYYQVVLPVE